MPELIGQYIYKLVLTAFLAVILIGLYRDNSIDTILFRGAITAVATYITLVVYLSLVRMILRSGNSRRIRNDDS